jgi:anaerobic dimethyl sulfoxide reductase subunit B (iron-sulfur subunit)
MQMGFYFDQTRCTGCYACVVACKDWHDVPAGPASWCRVATLEQGEFPDLFVAFYTSSCYHCAEPACVAACPAGAIAKREEDGVVSVDREKCLGKDNCDLCLQACTYKSPQFGAEPNAKMQMCSLCPDRLEEGKKPICVAGCPMRALDAGPMDELVALYGDVKEAEGFTYSTDLKPSIIFKPKVRSSVTGGQE